MDVPQELAIDPAIFAAHPEVRLGVLWARGIDNRMDRKTAQTSARAWAEAQAAVAHELAGITVAEHPHIAPWRAAYRAFGAKPKRALSSVESLVRRVLAGPPLPSINPLVDLYNTVSLRHLVPVGGEDLDRIVGPLRLCVAGADEPPVQLLGAAEAHPPRPGEIIYRDDLGAVCRRWNWKEAARTRLTPTTRNAILIIEHLPPLAPTVLPAALDDLRAAVGHHCGGTLQTFLLDAQHPRCTA